MPRTADKISKSPGRKVDSRPDAGEAQVVHKNVASRGRDADLARRDVDMTPGVYDAEQTPAGHVVGGQSSGVRGLRPGEHYPAVAVHGHAAVDIHVEPGAQHQVR